MRTYTVEVTWRVLRIRSPDRQGRDAGGCDGEGSRMPESGLPSKSNRAEDQDGDIQILKDPEYDYESNLGRDRVTGIS